MKGIIKAAMASRCNPDQSFIEGFSRGADYYKKHLWHTSDKTPKKDQPLLLQMNNGMLVFGKFEGWGYSFSVPEENLTDKLNIVRWFYLKDIL